MFLRTCAAVVLAAAWAVSGAAQGRPIAYEDFIRLRGEAQKEAFRRADPGTKSALVREHARRWLARNRGTLDAGQVAAVEEGIAYVTPELYARPGLERMEREAALLRRLECRLGRDGMRAAFRFEPPPSRRSFGSFVEGWASWLWACLGARQ